MDSVHSDGADRAELQKSIETAIALDRAWIAGALAARCYAASDAWSGLNECIEKRWREIAEARAELAALLGQPEGVSRA